MAYSTLSDILAVIGEATLIQLTDEKGEGVYDEAKVDTAIAQVDAEIDGYLRSRYAGMVPLAAPVPLIVMGISRDLAIEELFTRKVEMGVPEAVKDKAARARSRLLDIQMGKNSLGIEPSSGPGIFATNKTADDKVFNKDKMTGFR